MKTMMTVVCLDICKQNKLFERYIYIYTYIYIYIIDVQQITAMTFTYSVQQNICYSSWEACNGGSLLTE